MRINRLVITNFKAFSHLEIELHENFTLLVGENGAGKTSILDALAVATGIWYVAVKGDGWRNIYKRERHESYESLGDTFRFKPATFVEIIASGFIDTQDVRWKRQIREGGQRTTNADARKALTVIEALMQREKNNPASATLPVLAYYGAGRLNLTSQGWAKKQIEGLRGRRRFDAYSHCLDGSIHHDRLNQWFLLAAVAKGEGQERAGHRAVRQAVMQCLPDCRAIWFDSERGEIVADLGGSQVPYYSLSAGQRVMLGMVADIAIRAETLNPHLGEEMIKATPGIVMIDELDVHLHPTWQRDVVKDLRKAFPAIQFICTSHSPQVFGELPPENILVCDPESRVWHHPRKSLGLDSNRILTEEMGALARDKDEDVQISKLAAAIEQEDFPKAEDELTKMIQRLGEDDPEVTRARTLMTFLRETR